MGLNWISSVKKHLKADDSNSQEIPSSIKRILFIGFEKIYGFHSLEWRDWDWPNAADYEAIFVNNASLYLFILELSKKYSEDHEKFPYPVFERLQKNIHGLEEQLLKVVNSHRQIFVVCTPSLSMSVKLKDRVYDTYSALGVYDWCPLPFKTHNEEGEIITDIDVRLSEYRKQVKNWVFHFDDQAEELRHFNRADLSDNEFYATIITRLFVNLSFQPLAIKLCYGVHSIGRDGKLNLGAVSGDIYLLHYPIGGDLHESIRSLLREFCNTDLPKSQEPDWIYAVLPPRGAELDEKIATLSSQIDELSQRKSQLLEERRSLEHWRKLLFETGDVLEGVVLEALKLLGLEEAKAGPKGSYDIVGKLDGESLIFEVKGLTKSAGRDEIFSLDKHIREFEIQNVGLKVAKGILVVNAFRNDPPDSRGDNKKPIFSGDAISHNNLLEFVLLDMRTLYQAVTNVIEGKLLDGKEFLKNIKESKGVYSYNLK